MAEIDRAMVEKVAKTARLNLSEAEINKYSRDLEGILSAFKKIDKVKTDNVKPTSQPIEMTNVTREDKVEEGLTRDEALSNTNNKEKGYFKGPKVT